VLQSRSEGSQSVTTSSSDTTATIVINRLATGPTPPQANGVWPNVLHTRITEVMKQMGTPPWSKRIIADERNLVTLIATPPGGGNRPHWHKEFDEWWVVLGGRLQWELTGGIVVNAAKDDIVWVPRGTVHHIRNLGDELSLRLAVAMPPAMHYFSPCEQCGFTDDGPREWRA
jgi:mannose-6-phosphate isomerase-like protein (cupin superfamily)